MILKGILIVLVIALVQSTLIFNNSEIEVPLTASLLFKGNTIDYEPIYAQVVTDWERAKG
jgi:hypothetical protein